MSKTRSKHSSNTLVTLSTCGALFALAGAALGQGVQGPNTFQGGTGGIAPGNLQTGKPAGAVDTFNKGPGTAGAVDTFNKGTTGAAGFIWFNKGGPNPAGAEPPPSPSKGAGANPAAMGNFENKNPAAMGNFEAKQSGKASVPVGPRAAGYLKSPSKGDPKAKIGDIKGAKVIGEDGLVSPRDAALKSKANIKGGEIIGEDGLRSCATGKVC